MKRNNSLIHSQISGRQIKPLQNFDAAEYQALTRLGISLDSAIVTQMARYASGVAMDAITPSVTTASIATPVQFLQNWLPGLVYVVTAARKIDELVGIMTTGAWEDEEIVQTLLEQLGKAVPYSDNGNIPLSSWNPNYNSRTNVRFEEGMQVNMLEERRADRVNINSSAEKRAAAALALEIARNSVGFNGYNSGNNNTYGFLNDPSLPAYVTLANGASGSPNWSTKTYLEITRDIRSMFAALRSQSNDVIDPKSTPTTLALATDVVDFLSVTPDFGNSVQDWLDKTYPNCRVVSAPELNDANGGANVGYLYADEVADSGTDGGKTFIQMVPTKFMVLGVEKDVKSYKEDYSNATAGLMCKRPYAVVRRSGF